MSRRGIDFLKKGVNPPSSLYIAPEEELLARILSSEANTSIAVEGRLMLPNGSVTSFSYTVATTSALISVDQVLPISEGFLLGLLVRHISPAVQRGQVFVVIMLVRGITVPSVITQTLISDYVVVGPRLGWPPAQLHSPIEGRGHLFSFVGADPAAGAEISVPVPSNTRWRIHSFRAELVTDVSDFVRQVLLSITNGASIMYLVPAVASQAASLSRFYNFYPTGHIPASFASNIITNNPSVILPQGFTVDTVTSNLQAGDNWGAPRLLIEQWIED